MRYAPRGMCRHSGKIHLLRTGVYGVPNIAFYMFRGGVVAPPRQSLGAFMSVTKKVAGAMCKTSAKQMGRERQTVGNTPVSPMV